MKDKGIIFSGPMVRALLAGTKTQTRRLVKLQPKESNQPALQRLVDECPYGPVGRRLYVRETWAPYDAAVEGGSSWAGMPVYRATWPPTLDERHDAGMLHEPKRWKPAIHMPRSAARIHLDVRHIRVEQLQEITDKDIVAEGAVARYAPVDLRFVGSERQPVSAFNDWAYLDLRSLWAAGWDAINGTRAPWASNPWVYVLMLRKVEP